MKIVNALVGKIGHSVIGPKQYLNETLKLGEAAICIARDAGHKRPSVWLVGGIETLIDYISLARSTGELEEDVATMLLAKMDELKKAKPNSAMERLASIMGVNVDNLKEMIEAAQVSITAPIEGITDFSSLTPKWIAKAANYASIH